MNGFLAARFAVTGTLLAIAGAAFLALAVFAGVQTARIEGFHVWPVSVTGWKKTAQDRQATIDELVDAQGDAEAIAEAARAATEAAYSDIAERIDDNAQDTLDTALAAADRFVAAGGMRAETAGHPARCAPAPAGDHGARHPETARPAPQLDAAGPGAADPGQAAAGSGESAEGLVLVSPADIRICTVNTVKAEAGHALATQLEAASAPAE